MTIIEGEHSGDYLVSYIVLAVAFAAESVSILIGPLLLVVAAILAHSNASLLVRQAVPERIHDRIAADIAGIDVVTAVPTLFTMRIGPGDILVAAKADFADDVPAGDIEASCDEAERRLRATFPGIRYVFLDPTRGQKGSGG